MNSDLQDEITALIKPWRESEDEPPFSHRELIAMALVFHDEPLTPQKIMQWIASKFSYYGDAVAAGCWAHCTAMLEIESNDDDDMVASAETFVRDLVQTFLNYDLPVTKIPKKGGDDGNSSYKMSTAAAQITLQRLIPGKTKGTFPFLRLPAELRTAIYEMVLGYPHELDAETNSEHVVLQASTREPSTFSFKAWEDIDGEELQLPSPGGILTLLLANKQIAEEATSCFYRLNTFYCYSNEEMLEILQRLAPSRRQHLEHLAFDYVSCNAQSGYELFELLATLPNLRKLDIRIDEDELFAQRITPRGSYFTAPTIPGLGTLAKLGRGVDVQLAGNCPTVTAHFKAMVENPSQLVDVTPKKRKQPARTAKARKKRST